MLLSYRRCGHPTQQVSRLNTGQLCHDGGRVWWPFDDIKKCAHIIIKFGINAAACYDLTPDNNTIEAVLFDSASAASPRLPYGHFVSFSFSNPIPTHS
jgi:hypothetical protein